MQKAKDRYHNGGDKKKVLNIIFLIKRFKIGNKYRNLFDEQKETKREYGSNSYKNTTKNEKKTKTKTKNKLEEYQRNHQALKY